MIIFYIKTVFIWMVIFYATITFFKETIEDNLKYIGVDLNKNKVNSLPIKIYRTFLLSAIPFVRVWIFIGYLVIIFGSKEFLDEIKNNIKNNNKDNQPERKYKYNPTKK